MSRGEPPEYGVCVGSLDVKALYPSLDIEACSKICQERVMNSSLKVEDWDVKWATIYCALNMSREEVIREDMGMIIPRRIATSGKDPTVLTAEKDEKVDRWQWAKPIEAYTNHEKKKIMGKITQIMVRATFSTHHYKWNGRIFKQMSGGPIGLRATGSVAKCTMDEWIAKFRKMLLENGVIVHLLVKYVDDVLVIADNIKPGSRLHQGKLVHKPEWEAEDRKKGITPSQNTMAFMMDCANSLFSFLQFTCEVGDKEGQGDLPGQQPMVCQPQQQGRVVP